jgi:dUTP pyrophosphatase
LVKFSLLPGARAPTRGSRDAAGYDLYAYENASAVGPTWIRTGVRAQVPLGFVGVVCERSSVDDFQVMAGIIDADYRGEIKVKILPVDRDLALLIDKGRKIAQMIVVPCETDDVEIVEEDQLGMTPRGEKGFGSSGA